MMTVKRPFCRRTRRRSPNRYVHRAPLLEFHHLGEEAVMLLAALFGSVQRYLRYRALLSSIETLDDRMLYDIGLNRSELSAAAWAPIEPATAYSPLPSR